MVERDRVKKSCEPIKDILVCRSLGTMCIIKCVLRVKNHVDYGNENDFLFLTIYSTPNIRFVGILYDI
jgi:hypothetical protein